MTSNSMPSAAKALSLVVHVVFVISGISALLYQIVWQRSLLVLYGSNTESIAMVVSAFLVGLGCGSLLGGIISKHGIPLVPVFAVAELVIGLYGLISLRLFHWVAEYTLDAGTLETGVLAFALVFIPTCMMGSTLPLLVTYRVRVVRHVGQSVSWLYFVNTLGASLGAFMAPFVFLGHYGLSGTVIAAALGNLLSALIMFVAWVILRKHA